MRGTHAGSRQAAMLLGLASALGAGAYLLPFVQPAVGSATDATAHAADAPFLFLALVVTAAGALTAESRASGGSASKLVALLGALVAVNSALRLLPSLAGASPLFLLIVLVGYAYGATHGYLLGTLTLVVSAIITGGVGPWLPYQMLGAGWMGLTAGWLPDLRTRPRVELVMLAAFGAVWGLLYGALLNLWFWPFLVAAEGGGWTPGLALDEGLRRFGLFYLLTSLGYDLWRAGATAVLTLALGRALLVVLRRFQRRFTWQPITLEAAPAAVRPPEAPAPGAAASDRNDRAR